MCCDVWSQSQVLATALGRRMVFIQTLGASHQSSKMCWTNTIEWSPLSQHDAGRDTPSGWIAAQEAGNGGHCREMVNIAQEQDVRLLQTQSLDLSLSVRPLTLSMAFKERHLLVGWWWITKLPYSVLATATDPLRSSSYPAACGVKNQLGI